MTYRYSVLVVAILAIISFGASATMALDTPSISLGDAGHAKQAITITAGASGLPSGFAVYWMTASDYYANGSQWPDAITPQLGYAHFTGAPTLNTFGGQYTTFLLGPNESIVVEIGDLADESGVTGTTDELEYGQAYYYCAFALDGSGERVSAYSASMESWTTLSTNCTYTQGYWKTHKDMWPVITLDLGTVSYTKQELCDILDQPVVGNGLISLAHQLIAAKLNIANGADPTDANAAILAADALIGGLVVPPVGGGYLAPASTSALTQTLDDYNNGIIGPGHCGTVGAEEKSWGQVKSLFR